MKIAFVKWADAQTATDRNHGWMDKDEFELWQKGTEVLKNLMSGLKKYTSIGLGNT